jgi:hypothetical protein
MITLDRYGLHWMEGDIALLVQPTGVSHVLGIQMDFPVEVKKLRRGITCPHNIHLDDAEDLPLPDDELVRAMLPVPKQPNDPVLFIDDSHAAYVRNLLHLSSSGPSSAVSLWSLKPEVADVMLRVTNVAPLVVVGFSYDTQIRYGQIIEMAHYAERQLILVGPKSAVLRPEVKRINVVPQVLQPEYLSRAGAWHLKQRMLNRAS